VAVGGSLLGHIGGADHTACDAAHLRLDRHCDDPCAVESRGFNHKMPELRDREAACTRLKSVIAKLLFLRYSNGATRDLVRQT
jgi:hypothetical protein